MKRLLMLLSATLLTLAATATPVVYSTEASITPGKNPNQYEVSVHISQVDEQNGRTTETLISSPRVLADRGQKASCFTGSKDAKAENISVEVFCPLKSARDFATCTVTVRLGGQLLSRSVLKLKLDGE